MMADPVVDSYAKGSAIAKNALKYDLSAQQLFLSSKPELKRESFKRAFQAADEYQQGQIWKRYPAQYDDKFS
jgi:hypothetical protein